MINPLKPLGFHFIVCSVPVILNSLKTKTILPSHVNPLLPCIRCVTNFDVFVNSYQRPLQPPLIFRDSVRCLECQIEETPFRSTHFLILFGNFRERVKDPMYRRKGVLFDVISKIQDRNVFNFFCFLRKVKRKVIVIVEEEINPRCVKV